MAKRQVGKCRFYCDIPSYLKSIGKYKGTRSDGLRDSNYFGKETWNMNPYQINSHYMVANRDDMYIDFWLYQDVQSYDNLIYTPDTELSKLLSFHTTIDSEDPDEHHSSGWYAGILGHNLASLGITHVAQRFLGTNSANSTQYANQTAMREIVNFKTQSVDINIGDAGYPEHDGYSLWEITNKPTSSHRYNVLQFYYAKDE